MNRLAIATSLLLLATSGANAAAWHADGKSSTLTFSAVSQGAGFTGKFNTFDAKIDFDPSTPAAGKFFVTIGLASADTVNTERDQTLHGKDFFDVAHYPTATYTATRFRNLGGGRYAADGTLNLRGVSKPVTLTFTWTPGSAPTLAGDAALNRLDFHVGGGDWADTSVIGNAVKVHTTLKLAPAGK